MLSCELSHRFEVYLTACGAHVKQELFCKSTILDIGQDLLHCFLGIFGNDLRTCDVIAVFSGVGNRISHACETGLIDQVNNQFHFMNALEVCVSRIIASFYQSFETSLHQCAYAAAQNCLLAEQVCLCLGTEGSL